MPRGRKNIPNEVGGAEAISMIIPDTPSVKVKEEYLVDNMEIVKVPFSYSSYSSRIFIGVCRIGDPHLYVTDNRDFLPPDLIGNTLQEFTTADLWRALEDWDKKVNGSLKSSLNGMVVNTFSTFFEMEFMNEPQTIKAVPSFKWVENCYRIGFRTQIFLRGKCINGHDALYALCANPARKVITGFVFTINDCFVRNFNLFSNGIFREVA